MRNIIIVTEQPGDIFSEYLQGRGVEVTRMTPRQIRMIASEKEKVERILIVNLNLDEACSLKEIFPNTKVMAVTGGHEKFTASVSDVYGKENYDAYPFGDWFDFEKIIFSKDPRPTPKLIYLPERDMFKVNKQAIKIKNKTSQVEFDDFIECMVYLSTQYFFWMNGWIKGAQGMMSPLNFHYKKNKKIRTVILPLENNEFEGLPVFKVDDEVELCDVKQKKMFSGTITEINNRKMNILLEKEINRKELENVKFFHPVVDLYLKRVEAQQKMMESFSSERETKREKMKDSDNFWAYSPFDFLTNCGKQISTSSSISLHSEPFSLPGRMRFILRDSSQIEALVDSTGPEFFSLTSGPAATGKTFFDSCLIQRFVSEGKIVVITSKRNRAVDEALLAVTQILPVDNIIRLGNDQKAIMPDIRPLIIKVVDRSGEEKKRSESETGNDKTDTLLENHEGFVIGVTLDSYSLVMKLLGKKPQIVIIDEVSEGYFYDLLPIIASAEERVCMTGDNKQLGNIAMPKQLYAYLEDRVKKNDLPPEHPVNRLKLPRSIVYYFQYGFFNSIIELGYLPVNLLKINRRSLKNLSDLASEVFYDGEIVCGLFSPAKNQQGLIVFYDTKKIEKAVDQKKGTSSFNTTEVNFLVKKFMQRAVNVVANGGSVEDLVAIASYNAQVGMTKEKLRKHLLFAEGLLGKINEINIDNILDSIVITVDKIQGGKRKIVFISLVKSNVENNIGFNNDVRRIRVTCTRAQEEMIFVGNSETFINCGYPEIENVFKGILSFVKKRGIYKVLKEK